MLCISLAVYPNISPRRNARWLVEEDEPASESVSCPVSSQVGIFSSLPPYPCLTYRYGVGSVYKAWQALIVSSSGKLWSNVSIVEGHGPIVQSSKLRTQIYPPISFAHGLPPDLSGGSRSSDSTKRTRPPTTRWRPRRTLWHHAMFFNAAATARWIPIASEHMCIIRFTLKEHVIRSREKLSKE